MPPRKKATTSSLEAGLAQLFSKIDSLVAQLEAGNKRQEEASKRKEEASKPKSEKQKVEAKIAENQAAIKELETAERLARTEEEREQLAKKQIEAVQQQIELQIKLAELSGASEKEIQKLVDEYNQLKDSIEAANKAVEQSKKAYAIGKSSAEKMGKSIGLVNSSTVDTVKLLSSKKGLGNAISGFTKETTKLLRPANLAANIIDQFKENTVNLFKAISEQSAKARSTFGNFGREVTRQSLTTADAIRVYNMDANKSFDIQTNLANSLAIYRKASDSQIQAIAGQNAAFEKLGVSQEEQGKTYQTLTTTMDHTPEAANQITRSFLKMSQKSKIPLQTLFKTFNENNNSLLMFGKNATNVGMQLAHLEGNAKLNAGSLASMAERMMSFEEASESISDVNSVLGGTYVSIDEIQQLSSDGDIGGIMERIGQGIEASNRSITEFLESPQQVAAMAKGLKMPVNELRDNLKALERGKFDAARANAEFAEQLPSTAEQLDQAAKATMGWKDNLAAMAGQFVAPATWLGELDEYATSFTAVLRDKISSIVSLVAGARSVFSGVGTMAANALGVGGGASAGLGTAASAGAGAAGATGAAGAAGAGGSALKTVSNLAGAAGGAMKGAANKAGGALSELTEIAMKETPELATASKAIVEGLTTKKPSPKVYETAAKAISQLKNLRAVQAITNLGMGVGSKFAAFSPAIGPFLNAASAIYRFNNNDPSGMLVDIGAAATGAAAAVGATGALGPGAMAAAPFLQAASTGFNIANIALDFTPLGNMVPGGQKKYAGGTGGFVQGKTNAIIGESGPEMVLPMNRMGSFLAAPIRTAIESIMNNSAASPGYSGEATPLNAKIEITLNGQVLKDFVLKTVGAELTPLV